MINRIIEKLKDPQERKLFTAAASPTPDRMSPAWQETVPEEQHRRVVLPLPMLKDDPKVTSF
jgi:hypothetical protein